MWYNSKCFLSPSGRQQGEQAVNVLWALCRHLTNITDAQLSIINETLLVDQLKQCYAMLTRPSSMLPVFEEKVLVVAGEGWDSNVEQCCSCCARTDESRQGKQFDPLLCKDSSLVLTCLA